MLWLEFFFQHVKQFKISNMLLTIINEPFLLMTPSLVFCCFKVELVLTTLEFFYKHNNHEYVFYA